MQRKKITNSDKKSTKIPSKFKNTNKLSGNSKEEPKNSNITNLLQFLEYKNIINTLESIKRWKINCLVLFLAVIIRVHTLWGSFIWDDRAAILLNEDVKPSKPFTSLFFHDFWGQNIRAIDSHKSYRPITTLTYRINWILHGENARGFHLVNLALHGLMCILVLLLARRIFGQEPAALVATLTFVFHPMHTESVAALVGRADLLAGCFFIGTLLLTIPAPVFNHSALRESSDPARVSLFRFTSALLLGGASAFSKETGVTIFGLLTIREAIIALQSRPIIAKKSILLALYAHIIGISDAAAGKERTKWTTQSYYPLGRLILTVVCPFLIVLFHLSLHGQHAMYKWTIMENDIHLLPNRLHRALSYGFVHFLYFYKLVWPVHSCYDYGFPCIKPITSVTDPRNICTFLFYFVLVFACGRALGIQDLNGKGLGSMNPRLAWALSLMFVPFLPASQVFFPVGVVLGERLLYVPSVGFAVGVGLLFFKNSTAEHVQWLQKNSNRLASLAIWMIWIIFCAVKSIHRGCEWLNERSLFLSALNVCPDSVKNLNNLAFQRLNPKEATEAGMYLDRALKLHPNYPEGLFNRGLASYLQGNGAEAAQFLEAHLVLKPHDFRTKVHLGQSYLSLAEQSGFQNEKDQAAYFLAKSKHWLDNALKQSTDLYPLLYHQRGCVAAIEGSFELALFYFQEAVEQNKVLTEKKGFGAAGSIEFEKIYNMIALCLQNQNKIEEAVGAFKKAIEYNPASYESLSNLASLQLDRGDYDEARANLQAAKQNNPNSPEIVNNLGWLAELTGDYKTAA